MFENFPKTRPVLPKEIADIYATHYKANREGATTASSLAQKMESWLHKQVAKDVAAGKNPKKTTLELGAGRLNQLRYEPSVDVYDIVEPFTSLFKESKTLKKSRNVYADIAEIPEHYRYDRITSIAVFEHICNLPEVIARSACLLSSQGVFRASIPSEGTWLWTLGWKLSTGLEFRLKHGLDYGLLMKHEHVNTADEIDEVLNYFFKVVSHKVFGISRGISLYRYYECYEPDLERCQLMLKKYS
jgi:hypothetical protein